MLQGSTQKKIVYSITQCVVGSSSPLLLWTSCRSVCLFVERFMQRSFERGRDQNAAFFFRFTQKFVMTRNGRQMKWHSRIFPSQSLTGRGSNSGFSTTFSVWKSPRSFETREMLWTHRGGGLQIDTSKWIDFPIKLLTVWRHASAKMMKMNEMNFYDATNNPITDLTRIFDTIQILAKCFW